MLKTPRGRSFCGTYVHYLPNQVSLWGASSQVITFDQPTAHPIRSLLPGSEPLSVPADAGGGAVRSGCGGERDAPQGKQSVGVFLFFLMFFIFFFQRNNLFNTCLSQNVFVS